MRCGAVLCSAVRLALVGHGQRGSGGLPAAVGGDSWGFDAALRGRNGAGHGVSPNEHSRVFAAGQQAAEMATVTVTATGWIWIGLKGATGWAGKKNNGR